MKIREEVEHQLFRKDEGQRIKFLYSNLTKKIIVFLNIYSLFQTQTYLSLKKIYFPIL